MSNLILTNNTGCNAFMPPFKCTLCQEDTLRSSPGPYQPALTHREDVGRRSPDPALIPEVLGAGLQTPPSSLKCWARVPRPRPPRDRRSSLNRPHCRPSLRECASPFPPFAMQPNVSPRPPTLSRGSADLASPDSAGVTHHSGTCFTFPPASTGVLIPPCPTAIRFAYFLPR